MDECVSRTFGRDDPHFASAIASLGSSSCSRAATTMSADVLGKNFRMSATAAYGRDFDQHLPA